MASDALTADALLDALFSSAPVGLGFVDRELRFRRVNERLAEIDGLSVEEHLGRTLEEVLGELGSELTATYRRVLDSGRPVEGLEVSGATASDPGRERRWLVSYYPVHAPDGTPLGVGSVVLEVTREREAAERERQARKEAEAARTRAEVLASASAALGESMEVQGTVEALVRSAVPMLADWCTIHLAEPGAAPRLIAAAHADPARERLAWDLTERYPPNVEAPYGAAAVIRTGEAQHLFEIDQRMVRAVARDADHERMLRELGLRSALILPLRARGAVLGALTLILAESGRGYGPRTVELAESLAAQAAVALDNARLYSEQRDVAHTLQQTFLPGDLPEIPGIEVAARYRPAGRTNEVGGDFYDVFTFHSGEWTFVVGDVVGKGAQAAVLTALVRYGLQAAALRTTAPGDHLQLVNELLARRAVPGQFCTAVAGSIRLDGAGGAVMRLACAGHPPPLVLRAGGELESVEERGPLLGMLEDARFPEAEVRLAPGEALLLYTDGAFELRGTDPGRGEEALRAAVARSAGVDAAQLVERVEHETLMLSGGDPRDDLALLAVRARPAGPDSA